MAEPQAVPASRRPAPKAAAGKAIPSAKTNPAPAASPSGEAEAIAAIEKAGGSVRPLAQNDDRKEVSFYLQGKAVRDEHIAPIARIAKVARVHLGKTGITDAGLAHLRSLADLESLHLEGTAVTDQGLAHLRGLRKLGYLNLYGTQISDAGLEHLAVLPSLKSLYLWQTRVTPAGLERLRKALPETSIVLGWEFEARKPAQ